MLLAAVEKHIDDRLESFQVISESVSTTRLGENALLLIKRRDLLRRAAKGETKFLDACEGNDCGAPIGIERLLANPEATHCIECATQGEIKVQRRQQKKRF
jgi:RNA polymerase-binding transcription factor DksA